MPPILNEYTTYLLNLFGEKVQKVSIDAQLTCPNRDGTKGLGGCTFCNNKKFNVGSNGDNVKDQVHKKISKLKRNNKKLKKFLVYFQTYSNTYAPIDELEKLYTEALDHPEVVGLVIGTRPDCVNQEILQLLKKICHDKYLSIEFGLESIHDETLIRINRGHDVQAFINALKLAKIYQIPVGVHLIFGFPWEAKIGIPTANFLNQLDVNFVKIHNLQIVKNTIMGNDYLKKPFPLLSIDQYLNEVIDFIAHLSPQIIIQRLGGDCQHDILLASGFHESSKELKSILLKKLEEQHLYQGVSKLPH